MKGYLFITDLHITSSSNVRTGDVLADISQKLKAVADYANNNDLVVLIGGDVFDKHVVSMECIVMFLSWLKTLKYTPLSIKGNHDCRYRDSEDLSKTAYGICISSGLLKDLKYEDMGDYILTSQLPLKTVHKPQLCIFHGFLNADDGDYTVRMEDLITTDNCLVCLGHDHVEYDPVEFGTVRVLRPGSFLRGIRNDSDHRVPHMVHIILKDGVFRFKKIPIPARPYESLFKTKEASISTKETRDLYSLLIQQLSQSTTNEITLRNQLETITTPDIVEYIIECSNEYKRLN